MLLKKKREYDRPKLIG